jgi:hypothetical protein
LSFIAPNSKNGKSENKMKLAIKIKKERFEKLNRFNEKLLKKEMLFLKNQIQKKIEKKISELHHSKRLLGV